MKKLQVSATLRHRLIHRGKNGVLWVICPVVEGDTPAAEHTKALITALQTYAETCAAELAAEHLREALARGRLFDFSLHRFVISLEQKHENKHLHLSLTAHFLAGEETVTKRTLRICWEENERFQVRFPSKKTKKVERKA